MIKLRWTIFFVTLMGSVSFSQAQYEVLKLNFPQKPKTVNFQSPLAQLKKIELSRDWKKCAKIAIEILPANTDIKAWIYLAGLRCARREIMSDIAELKGKDLKKVPSSLWSLLESLKNQEALFAQGPWSAALEEEQEKSILFLAEIYIPTNRTRAWALLDQMIERKSRVSKSSLSKTYLLMADLAQAEAKLKWAIELTQYSLNEQDNGPARDKLQQLNFALNKEKPSEEAKATEILSEAEQKFEGRFKAALSASDQLALADDCVDYLINLPGGKKSKWCGDKLSELQQNYFSRNEDVKVQASMQRLIKLIERLDVDRVAEFARIFHRRSDFLSSLTLAEGVLLRKSGSKEEAVLLYVAGRSAQMLGRYQQAQRFFTVYIEKHGGAEDVIEVMFRLALVQIRLKEYSLAIASFEKLLLQKNMEKYELPSRYWMIRCLQAIASPRAEDEIKILQEKFLLSYYGLKLNIEKQKGSLDWPGLTKIEGGIKGEYFLTKQQQKVWQRVQKLASNSWSHEAYLEYMELANPFDADLKVLVASELSRIGIHTPAIRLVQGAVDSNPALRSLDVMMLTFPKVFQKAIDDVAKSTKISSVLVRSLMRQESAFNLQAVSTSNAYGLMQLIAPTAEEVISDLGLKQTLVPDDLFVPEVNIRLGTSYIAKMLKRFSGQVPFALAAYNAGPTRTKVFVESRNETRKLLNSPSADPFDELWMDEIPWFETSFYVKAIIRNSILYKLIDRSSGKTPEEKRVVFPAILWSDLVLTN